MHVALHHSLCYGILLLLLHMLQYTAHGLSFSNLRSRLRPKSLSPPTPPAASPQMLNLVDIVERQVQVIQSLNRMVFDLQQQCLESQQQNKAVVRELVQTKEKAGQLENENLNLKKFFAQKNWI